LRALAYVQLRNQLSALRSDLSNWKPLFDRKLIYNVLVAADGRIVGYAPALYNDNEAEQHVRSTVLRTFPQTDTEDQAVAYFFLTFKSSEAFQLDADTSISDPVLWKIPDTWRPESQDTEASPPL
jgi:hypothetical protein